MKLLITGGAGFIGSAVVRHVIARHRLVGRQRRQADLCRQPRIAGRGRAPATATAISQADICDRPAIDAVFAEVQPDAVLHLAAESHVDRSIDGAAPFIETNVGGTYTLLEAALAYWRTLDADARARFRFQHISTDEVFGSLGRRRASSPRPRPTRPTRPTRRARPASDHLVRAWHHTYGLPALTTNCSNNYGPYHFPEKLIPLIIIRALRGEQPAGLRQGRERARLAACRGPRRGADHGAAPGPAGRDLQCRRRQRAAEHRRGARDLPPARRDAARQPAPAARAADRVRHRPARP